MAAKRLAAGERLLDIQAAEQVEGYEVHSRREGEAPERTVLTDTPPERFVDRHPTEHGEVRVAFALDAMLRRLRAKRPGQAGPEP
jgi:hypothetical protein